MENKFTIKFLKSLFKNLSKEWNSSRQIEDLEFDAWEFEQFLGVLEKIYGFTNQDEKDWIYACFIENWKNLAGDFDDLTEENLIIPQLKEMVAIEDEWWDARITNTYKTKTYTNAMFKSDIYNGFADPDTEDTEWIERTDSEIEIKEVEPEEVTDNEEN